MDDTKFDVAADLLSFRSELLRRAAMLVGHSGDTEDLVHSAFEQALRRRDQFASHEYLQRWLYIVLKNLAIDAHRHVRTSRLARRQLLHLGPIEQAEPPTWGNFSERDIRRGLAECSPRLRETFELRHEQGLSLAEIGARMRVSINTVASRLFRARATIRRALLTQSSPANTNDLAAQKSASSQSMNEDAQMKRTSSLRPRTVGARQPAIANSPKAA